MRMVDPLAQASRLFASRLERIWRSSPERAQNLSFCFGVDDEGDSRVACASGVEIGDVADDGGGFEVSRSGCLAIEAEGLTSNVGDSAEFVFGLRKEMANLIQVVGAAGDVDEIGEAFEGIVDLVGDGCGEASGGGEFFGTHQGAFGHAALGDVAEDENDADHFAGAVADGGAAVVDADLSAILGDEEGVVGEADDGAEAADLVDGVFDGSPGLFVEDGEDLVEGSCLWPRSPSSR